MTAPHVEMDVYGLTDRGKIREVNQDHFLIASLRKLMTVEYTSIPVVEQERLAGEAMARMFLVADGVGGGIAGEEASELTLETIAAYVATTMRCFYRLDRELETDLLQALEASVRKSHALVQEAAAEKAQHRGMATTLTMAHVLWPWLYVVHVGDSRCYLVRPDGIARITRDQTLAQGLVDRGVLTEEAAAASPLSHVLSSAVGHQVFPTTYTTELSSGDALLLCTDGLTKHVNDARIREILDGVPDAKAGCEALRDAALEAGGSDNVTVVIGRFG